MERTAGTGRTRWGRWVTATVGVAVASMLLSACLLRATGEVSIESDGSGQIVVEVFPTRGAARLLEQIELEDEIAGTLLGEGELEISEIERDQRSGFVLRLSFDDYRRVAPLLVEGVQVGGERVVVFDSFEVTEDDDSWSLRAVIRPVDQVLSSDDGLVTVLDELLAAGGNPASAVGLELTVALPGRVVASNADRVDGGAGTWSVPGGGSAVELRMNNEPEEFPNALQLVLVTAGVLVAGGVALALVGAARPHARSLAERREDRRWRRRRARADVDPLEEWRSTAPPTSERTLDRDRPLPAVDPSVAQSATAAEHLPSPQYSPQSHPPDEHPPGGHPPGQQPHT